MYGKSTGNQRIEAWWSILRRQCTDIWIARFKAVVSSGRVNLDDNVHIQCLRFCFLPILTRDLQRMALEWNTHRINARKQEGQVSGKPDKMFFVPEDFDSADNSCDVSIEDATKVQEALEEETADLQMINPNFSRMVDLIEPNHTQPTTYEEALRLFCTLIVQLRRRPVV